MAVISPLDVTINVGAAVISQLTTYNAATAGTDPTRKRYFGATNAVMIGGERTRTLSIGGDWDPADTAGQVALRAAWVTGAEVTIGIVRDAITETLTMIVTGYSDTADADGVSVEWSADLESVNLIV